MTYRLRNLAVAIALAVLAALFTSFYVNQQKERLQSNQEPTAVFVATEDIPVGTSGSDVADLLEEQQVAREAVVPGAVVSPSDLDGKVVTEKVYAGEQVTTLRFSAPSEQGIRAHLSGNMRALQIPGSEHQFLAGTLQDGDRVDVLGSWALQGDNELKVTRIVLRDILVLRAPSSAVNTDRLSAEGAAQSNAVVLGVTDAQAQKLFWIFTNGDWWLDLRPSDSPSDSPEGLEWSGTMISDGLSGPKLQQLLNDPKQERTP